MSDNHPNQSDIIEERLRALEFSFKEIQERNKRVEIDKAWETSLARKVVIAGLTYLVTASVFWGISVPTPFANALIPCTGYIISTLTIPWAKGRWFKTRAKR